MAPDKYTGFAAGLKRYFFFSDEMHWIGGWVGVGGDFAVLRRVGHKSPFRGGKIAMKQFLGILISVGLGASV